MNSKYFLSITAAALVAFSSTVALAQTATADGEIKKIDQAAGKVTVHHGPIKAFDMPDPMTMVYRVKDPAMLKGFKVGEKVKFDADHETGGFTITKLQKK